MKKVIITLSFALVFFSLFSINSSANAINSIEQLKEEFDSQLLEQIDNTTGSERESLIIKYD